MHSKERAKYYRSDELWSPDLYQEVLDEFPPQMVYPGGSDSLAHCSNCPLRCLRREFFIFLLALIGLCAFGSCAIDIHPIMDSAQ